MTSVACAFCGRTLDDVEGMFLSTLREGVAVCVACAELLKRAVAPNRSWARENGEDHWTCHIGGGADEAARP